MDQYEIRQMPVSVTTKKNTLYGYAAVFDSPACVGSFTEVLKRGCFTESLNDGSDILALADHDMRAVLGRTKSGTLKLKEDEKGLAFELDLPDTQAAHDVRALCERGDIGGMSFGFVVKEGGENWENDTRIITDVALIEISVVKAYPAYADTSVAVRADLVNRLTEEQQKMKFFIATL